jgi:hypothetical protein
MGFRKMSTWKEIIAQSTAKNKDLVSMTVRVPETVRSFVEEFSDNLSLSRQEVLLKLLENGIAEAQRELEEQSSTEKNVSFHILNTNRGNNDDDHEMMMAEGIAAAFYNPWKHNIERIKVGDWLFLYENRKGIVAFGQGTGNTLKREHDGNADACYYQILKNFTLLEKPLPASEIKAILGRNQIFLKTMSGMPDGQKILEKVKEMSAEI